MKALYFWFRTIFGGNRVCSFSGGLNGTVRDLSFGEVPRRDKTDDDRLFEIGVLGLVPDSLPS